MFLIAFSDTVVGSYLLSPMPILPFSVPEAAIMTAFDVKLTLTAYQY
jgi:hypothetical protein